MKIMICGSMTFAREMFDAKNKLEEFGCLAEVPYDAKTHARDHNLIDDFKENEKYCIENDVIKKCMNQIAKSDAILILNYPKNGIDGYVGTSSLMEMGLAYYLGKKIFLLYPAPKPDKARWAHETNIINPIIINGDLSLIK